MSKKAIEAAVELLQDGYTYGEIEACFGAATASEAYETAFPGKRVPIVLPSMKKPSPHMKTVSSSALWARELIKLGIKDGTD